MAEQVALDKAWAEAALPASLRKRRQTSDDSPAPLPHLSISDRLDTGNVRGDGSDATFGRLHRTLVPLGRGDVLSVQLHVLEIATIPRPRRATKCRRRWPSPSRHADVAAQWR